MPTQRGPLGLAFPAALLAATLLAPSADAQTGWAPRLSLDGFGTVGITYSSEEHADFIENTTRSEGPGYSRRLDPSVDSRLGGQATLDLGSRFRAVVQLIAEPAVDGNYAPHVEWANVGYSFTPDFKLRGGRIALPAFMVSDARKVSYATPWVRPPVEVYGIAPIYSLDGVDVTYRRRVGEWTGSVNAATGGTRSEFPDGAIDAKNLWNVNATLVRGALTSRVVVSGAELRVDVINPLFDAFRAFGPEGEALAVRFDIDGRSLRFAAAGVEYDKGSWFGMAEAGWLDTNSAIGERVAGYVTGGYRWRTLTPYLSYSRSAALSELSVDGLTLTGLPPAHAELAAALNDRLNSILKVSPVQQNVAIGGRWDFWSGLALKAQVDFINVFGESPGTFINPQPGFEPGGNARVFSIATAFVF